MLTELGKFLRKLRLDRNELLGEMAEKLSISPSYLSAIENGKRPIPKSFITNIKCTYRLSAQQMTQLRNIANFSKVEVKPTNEFQYDVAIGLARGLHNLSEVQLEKIQKILSEGKRNGK